jgi:hypothetical protein
MEGGEGRGGGASAEMKQQFTPITCLHYDDVSVSNSFHNPERALPSFSAQDLPCVHFSLPLDPILSQLNPVDTPTA